MYLVVRKCQTVMRVGQGSIDGNIMIFYRIVIETIQVFCFGKIRRCPVRIAVREDVLVAVVIVSQVVERYFYSFILSQPDDGRRHIIIVGNDLHRMYMLIINLRTLGMHPATNDTNQE